MFSLRIMVKNSRGKKTQEETEKQQHVIVKKKTNYLKVLLQKVFEITTKSSLVSLTVAPNGIPYAV